MKLKKIKSLFLVLISVIIALGLSIAIQSLFAWTAPTAVPPSNNVAAPLNTSGDWQTKAGALSINTNGVNPYGLIVENGNVGIGTTTPSEDLTIYKNHLGGYTTLLVENYGEQSGSEIILREQNQDNFTIRYNSLNSGLNNWLEFWGNGAGSGMIMNMKRDGNRGVGIGLASETDPTAKLDVRNNGIEDILNLYDDTQEVLTVLDGGNVGIGTISPQTKLDVNGLIKLYNASSGGTCNANKAGAIFYDTDETYGDVRVCRKNGAGGYEWKKLKWD